VTEKVLLALQLDPAEYKLGNTKVFFKAGVLGCLILNIKCLVPITVIV
jgi:myosin heavy subunit